MKTKLVKPGADTWRYPIREYRFARIAVLDR
jgi:hypothetical protein